MTTKKNQYIYSVSCTACSVCVHHVRSNYPSMNGFNWLEMFHRIQISWSSTNRENVATTVPVINLYFPVRHVEDFSLHTATFLSMNLPLQYAGKVILIFDDETTSSRGTLIKHLKVSSSLFLSVSMREKQTNLLDLLVTVILLRAFANTFLTFLTPKINSKHELLLN